MAIRAREFLAAILIAAVVVLPASAQKPPPVSGRSETLDPAAIRRDAGKLAEVRTLLSDPDANVRLLAMREVIRIGDPVQRQLAIEAGLSSGDSAMLELALRSVMMNVQKIVILLTNLDGQPITKSDYNVSSVVLEIQSFDAETGKFSGTNLAGQLQGSVLSFVHLDRSGLLTWDPDKGEFIGTVNVANNRIDAARRGTWRLR